jgi:hypothetical protein
MLLKVLVYCSSHIYDVIFLCVLILNACWTCLFVNYDNLVYFRSSTFFFLTFFLNFGFIILNRIYLFCVFWKHWFYQPIVLSTCHLWYTQLIIVNIFVLYILVASLCSQPEHQCSSSLFMDSFLMLMFQRCSSEVY